MKISAILCLLLLASLQPIYPQILSGRITNNKNEPLPYTNVFCSQLNTGTTSNFDGEFIFKLSPGKKIIIFSYVGYKSDTLSINLAAGKTYEVNIVLKENPAQMPTVYIFDSIYSEAERIVLKVIASKTDYLDKIKNYEYMAYDKTVLSVKRKDSVIIGGVLETQTKAFFMQPDKFNEIVLSKRQTKNIMPSYTNFFTMGKISNILDEEIRIDESSVISPFSASTFKYYSFQMKDTTFYNNRRVFVITFEPKNNIIPLFSGELGIIDEIYLPVFLKLNGLNSVLTALRKEIEIEEKFAEFNGGLWMPVFISEKYIFNMSFPGLPYMYGNHTCLLSEYKINNPDFNFQFTKNIQTEKLLPESEAKNLWENNQQIALTKEEKKAVAKIDSVMDNSPFILKSILWVMQNSMGGLNDLPVTSFNDFYHFNRVEGHYAGAGLRLNNIFERTNVTVKTGYGFSDKKIKYNFIVSHRYKNIAYRVGLFSDVKKLNRFYNYGDFDITFQSWIDKNDFADYYYSKGLEAGIDFQLHENFLIGLGYSKRKDSNAKLNSDWSLFNKKAFYKPVPQINEGNIAEYILKLSYDDKNYYDLGFIRMPDRSKSYFDGEFQITRGYFSSFYTGSYWQSHIILNGYHQSNSWFNPSLTIRGGINTGLKLKQNLFHLPGNFGTFSSPKIFNTLKTDEYLGDKYVSIFLENNFSNIIYRVLGIPFLKNSKYDFLIFGKFGWIDEEPPVHFSKSFYEAGIGIGNIFSFLRLDFTWRMQPHSKNIFYVDLVSMFDF